MHNVYACRVHARAGAMFVEGLSFARRVCERRGRVGGQLTAMDNLGCARVRSGSSGSGLFCLTTAKHSTRPVSGTAAEENSRVAGHQLDRA